VVLLTTVASGLVIVVVSIEGCAAEVGTTLVDEPVVRLPEFETLGVLPEISERTKNFHSSGIFWRSCLLSRQDMEKAAINASKVS
jgi:hypothetical protein